MDSARSDEILQDLVKGLNERVQNIKLLTQCRALGSALDLSVNTVACSENVDAFTNADPQFVDARENQSRLQSLLKSMNFVELDSGSASFPSTPSRRAARRAQRTTTALSRMSSSIGTPSTGIKGIFSPIRSLGAFDKLDSSAGKTSRHYGFCENKELEQFKSRVLIVHSTAQRLVNVQRAMNSRMLVRLVFSPAAHLPLIASSSSIRVLRGPESTSGKAYAALLYSKLLKLRKDERKDEDRAAAQAMGLEYEVFVESVSKASSTGLESDMSELFSSLPTFLHFTSQRLARLPLGHGALVRALASPHAVSLAAGAFWLCIISIQENLRLQKERRLKEALKRGLTLKEAEEAVERAEAAEIDLNIQGIKCRSSDETLTPTLRRSALLFPDSESEAVSSEASLLALIDCSPERRQHIEDLTKVMSSVYYSLFEALGADDKVEFARAKLRPLREASLRERAEWEAMGGIESGMEKPLPPPAYPLLRPGVQHSLRSLPAPTHSVQGDSPSVSAARVLPWAIADTVWSALNVLCPSSFTILNAKLKLEVFVRIGGLLGGLEVNPTVALSAMDTAFLPLCLIPPPTSWGEERGGTEVDSNDVLEDHNEISCFPMPFRVPVYPPSLSYALLDPRDPTDAYGCAALLCCIKRRGKKQGIEPYYPAPELSLRSFSHTPPPRSLMRLEKDEHEQARLLGYKNPALLFRSTTKSERGLMGLRNAVKAEISRGAFPTTRIPPSAFLASGAPIPPSQLATTSDIRSLLPPPAILPSHGSPLSHALSKAQTYISRGAAMGATERALNAAGIWGRDVRSGLSDIAATGCEGSCLSLDSTSTLSFPSEVDPLHQIEGRSDISLPFHKKSRGPSSFADLAVGLGSSIEMTDKRNTGYRKLPPPSPLSSLVHFLSPPQ